MKYDKPPLSFEEQSDLLIKRGLVVDRAFLIERLKDVNYYRLSGYLYPYRQSGDKFKLDYSLWSCHRVTLYKGRVRETAGVSDTGYHFDTLRSWRREIHLTKVISGHTIVFNSPNSQSVGIKGNSKQHEKHKLFKSLKR